MMRAATSQTVMIFFAWSERLHFTSLRWKLRSEEAKLATPRVILSSHFTLARLSSITYTTASFHPLLLSVSFIRSVHVRKVISCWARRERGTGDGGLGWDSTYEKSRNAMPMNTRTCSLWNAAELFKSRLSVSV